MAAAELFTSMMKEEWRIHSTIFGSISFALFPVMIFGIAFMGSFLLPLFSAVMPAGTLSLIVHAIFLILGVMVGAFGLIGTEAMNRRFGQASLIAYSARSLPVSERMVFFVFVLKDTVYYFILWVLPFVGGFLIASPFIGMPVTLPLLLLLTSTLAFLTGMSIIFFLSTVYARSKKALVIILAVIFTAWAALSLTGHAAAGMLFPPLSLFSQFSYQTLLVSLAYILVPSAVAVLLFTSEYTGTTKYYRNAIRPLTQKLSFFPSPPLAAKDLLDLYRSGGLIGQTLFSFLIPLALLWFLLAVIERLLPPGGLILLFAILTGVIASTIYTWLTTFDTFGSYGCLPISVASLMRGKICSFAFLQLIPVALIVYAALASGAAAYLVPALVLCLSLSFYALGITVWLTGLSPSVLVYDAKVLVIYLFSLAIPITVLIAIAFTDPFRAVSAAVLLLPAWALVRAGYTRWEGEEQPGF
jgi:hypothetical protein